MSQPPDDRSNENDAPKSGSQQPEDLTPNTGSTPNEGHAEGGESAAPESDAQAEGKRGGLRDEIEEILRDQGEEPVMPRRPRMSGSRSFSNVGGLLARRSGPAPTDAGSAASFMRAFMNVGFYFLLLRIAMGLAVGFIAFRILGPRAILLLIVIGLVIAAVTTARLMLQRSRN